MAEVILTEELTAWLDRVGRAYGLRRDEAIVFVLERARARDEADRRYLYQPDPEPNPLWRDLMIEQLRALETTPPGEDGWAKMPQRPA